MPKSRNRLIKGLLAVLLIVAISVAYLWCDRPEVDLPAAEASSPPASLTVSWFGVSTLLFDDGESQILIDGFFSRPSLLDVVLDRPVSPDEGAVKTMLQKHKMQRVKAVIPVHSHYDHAMDSALVASLTGAQLIGSESTANIARGSGLPEAQIRVANERTSYRVGDFTIEIIPSKHAPIVDGDPPFPGNVDRPLSFPTPLSAMKEGGSYSVVIHHPQGSALVQGSAGYIENNLAGLNVDSVFLGIGGLGTLGSGYIAQYLEQTVNLPQAEQVFVIHYDDFTRSLGDTTAFPRLVDDIEFTVEELKRYLADKALLKLPYGGAVSLAGD